MNENSTYTQTIAMRKLLYYMMLTVFFACAVWNALSKRDSIMGTGVYAADTDPGNAQLAGPRKGWESPGALPDDYRAQIPRVSSKW